MRIGISAHFWPNYTVGSGQYLRRVVEEIARLGTRHTFFLIGEQGAFADGVPPMETVELARGAVSAGRPAKLWFEQVALPRAARSLQLDLLHVPYLAPPLFSPVPTIVTVHDLIPLLLPAYRGNWRKWAYTWLDLQSTHRAAFLIAVSEHTRQDVVRHLHFPAERIAVTYEAAAPDLRPAMAEEVTAVRARYNLPPHFILYLGDSDIRKGIHRLIAVFARWRRANTNAKVGLVVAGPLHPPDGRLYIDLPALVHELGIEQEVRFLGPVPEADKASLYTAADLFAFLSEYEGFGLPPLEAMACGTPILAGKNSSIPEVVGDAGILVDPLDEVAIGAALARLLGNPAWRSELGREGLKRAAAFSWRRTAEGTIMAYERALQKG